MTKKRAQVLRVYQRAMERAMLGITLRNRQRNEDIKARTKHNKSPYGFSQRKPKEMSGMVYKYGHCTFFTGSRATRGVDTDWIFSDCSLIGIVGKLKFKAES
ncbi:hypothetical protein HUJ04_011042 [Dendroctonus ponderosae]|nr:hypothetical protein HUJ04_011042 [Dendroctonus ponderosae]